MDTETMETTATGLNTQIDPLKPIEAMELLKEVVRVYDEIKGEALGELRTFMRESLGRGFSRDLLKSVLVTFESQVARLAALAAQALPDVPPDRRPLFESQVEEAQASFKALLSTIVELLQHEPTGLVADFPGLEDG